MPEVRNMREGTLRWVQASGSGVVWATAATPQSGLFGFIQAGMAMTWGSEYGIVEDRGEPSHNKRVRTTPPTMRFTILEGVTADWPDNVVATASGASVPMVHLEFRERRSELPSPSALFYRLHGVPWPQGVTLTEQPEGNTREYVANGLSALVASGSGYLS